ncbi:hypothetical protein GS462_11310 [Rhodococcus hoagii]|nr:hypothetical protein [Prescottella equi]MBM4651000.1 hypothetical protein [Prescottella equi]MBM4686653.1 hypothetical protein [Prescottella equi]
MAIISQAVTDIAGADDNTQFLFYRDEPLSPSAQGDTILTWTDVPVRPVDGVLTTPDLAPGPAKVKWNGHTYDIVIPANVTGSLKLWPLIKDYLPQPPAVISEVAAMLRQILTTRDEVDAFVQWLGYEILPQIAEHASDALASAELAGEYSGDAAAASSTANEHRGHALTAAEDADQARRDAKEAATLAGQHRAAAETAAGDAAAQVRQAVADDRQATEAAREDSVSYAAIAGAAATLAVDAAAEVITQIGGSRSLGGYLRLRDESLRPGSYTFNLTGDSTIEINSGTSLRAYTVTLKFHQGAAGGRTVTFGGIYWADGVAPTMSPGAYAIDIIDLHWDGARWIGTVVAQNIKVPPT